jgi:hypothetical protein
MIYSTVAANRRGDYLRLENEVLAVDFPVNWFTFLWETMNETMNGKIYSLIMFAPDKFSAVSIRIFDEAATKQFFIENNFSDLTTVTFRETQRFFRWVSERSENASVISVENGTLYVGASRDLASYTSILIKDGYESDGVFYNMSCTVISYLRRDNFVQIAFWGKQEDYEEASKIFENVLNNTLVKKYGSE